jgi:hypothetical protein
MEVDVQLHTPEALSQKRISVHPAEEAG